MLKGWTNGLSTLAFRAGFPPEIPHSWLPLTLRFQHKTWKADDPRCLVQVCYKIQLYLVVRFEQAAILSRWLGFRRDRDGATMFADHNAAFCMF